MSLCSTVETGSFCLASIHFSISRLIVCLRGSSLCYCLAFSFSICWRSIGNVVVELSLWHLHSVACVLVSSFAAVGSSLVHGSVISFSELNYVVPSIGFSDLGFHILA